MKQISSKIEHFLAQYSISVEAKSLYIEQIMSILYIDIFERLAKLLPEPEKSQAQSYLTSADPTVDPDTHERIKAFVQKHMTDELVNLYLEENLEKILSMIAEKVALVTK